MKAFNPKHLKEVEETYFEHFKFASWAGATLILLGCVSLVHAVFPFLFARLPDRIYRYFVNKSKARIDRVNSTLKTKNLE